MSNSSLVDYTKISPNKNHPRQGKISKITIHHMAGNLTVETCGNVFANTSRQASANYGIGSDGRIGLYVDERDRAWTSSNAANDHVAVTIEVANNGGAPNWPVSDKAYASLINLCVDICKRNGIQKLNYTGDATGNLTRHNMFAATLCPGPYLQAKFPEIAAEVNKRLAASTTATTKLAKDGYIAGNDINRAANTIVAYWKGLKGNGKTGTNIYGREVQVDKNGVCLNDPVYGKCNMTIPKDGKVLSGHGTGATWIGSNLKAGYLVWITNGKINVSKKQHRSIDAKNGGRGADCLCVYDKGTSTGTNKWGYEVQIGSNGLALEAPHYSGNTKIPSGGFVLSGHSAAGTWIHKNVKKGTKVTISGNYVTIG